MPVKVPTNPTRALLPRAVLAPAVAASAMASWVPAALAQQETPPASGTPATTTPSGEYVPPTGEQPVYGKKYRPNTPSSDLILELNPLLLINRGIAVEFEKRVGEAYSLGGDLIYRDAEVYDKRGVTGNVRYVGVAPKFRIYPMSTMGGFFFGAKVMLGQTTLEISDGGEKTEEDVFTISPTAHVGYRFTTFGGFTLAGYVGGGINVPKPEIEKEDIQEGRRGNTEWNSARNDVNKATGLFRPDIGFTLGIAL